MNACMKLKIFQQGTAELIISIHKSSISELYRMNGFRLVRLYV